MTWLARQTPPTCPVIPSSIAKNPGPVGFTTEYCSTWARSKTAQCEQTFIWNSNRRSSSRVIDWFWSSLSPNIDVHSWKRGPTELSEILAELFRWSKRANVRFHFDDSLCCVIEHSLLSKSKWTLVFLDCEDADLPHTACLSYSRDRSWIFDVEIHSAQKFILWAAETETGTTEMQMARYEILFLFRSANNANDLMNLGYSCTNFLFLAGLLVAFVRKRASRYYTILAHSSERTCSFPFPIMK